MAELKDVREYSDFRDFLCAYFKAVKEKNNGRSLEKFYQRLGLSESALRMIMNGQRNLTVHNIHILAHAFGMSRAQTDIFEAMVLRDQAQSARERAFYSRRLKQTDSFYKATDKRIVSEPYLKKWYGPALLIYLVDNQINGDSITSQVIEGLSEKLRIPRAEIERLIAWYSEQGFLNTKKSAEIHFVADPVATNPNDRRSFVREAFLQALARLNDDYSSGRSLFSTKTFSISPKRIASFAQDYKQLMEKYISTRDATPESTVMQVCFSAIRVLESHSSNRN